MTLKHSLKKGDRVLYNGTQPATIDALSFSMAAGTAEAYTLLLDSGRYRAATIDYLTLLSSADPGPPDPPVKKYRLIGKSATGKINEEVEGDEALKERQRFWRKQFVVVRVEEVE